MVAERLGFWVYVEKKLAAAAMLEPQTPAEQQFVVSKEVIHHLESALRKVCDDTMVYPTIEPDGENGVCATWWADAYSFQILVGNDFSVDAIIRQPNEKPKLRHVDLSDEAMVQEMREHLHEMSANVKRANPNWQMMVAN